MMILRDHTRKGRKLIPPMLSMDLPLVETSWHVQRLPELFLIAFLYHRIGLAATHELVFEMTKSIDDLVKTSRKNEKIFRAYLLSEHYSLSQYEKEQIKQNLPNSTWLTQLRLQLSDMLAIWPDMPINYLAVSPASEVKTILVNEIKDILIDCYFRYNTHALKIQSIALLVEFRCGNMHLNANIDFPNLNAIDEYPDTDESKRAASFIVTACGAMILQRHTSENVPTYLWPRTFWNQCYHLQGCADE